MLDFGGRKRPVFSHQREQTVVAELLAIGSASLRNTVGKEQYPVAGRERDFALFEGPILDGAKRGAAVMSEPVTEIYTADVHTITPDISLDEVMRMMTERRIRHAPVVVDGTLRGIVSIGDVVKNRIDELETERAHLTDYITGIR